MIEYIEENGKVILDVTGSKKVCHFNTTETDTDFFDNYDHLIDIGHILSWIVFYLKQMPGTYKYVEPWGHQIKGDYTLIIRLFNNSKYTLSLLDMEVIQEVMLNEKNEITFCNDIDETVVFGTENRFILARDLENSYFDFSKINVDLREATSSKEFLNYFESRMKDLGFDLKMNKAGELIEGGKVPLPLQAQGSGVNALFEILYFLFFYGGVAAVPKILFAPRLFESLDPWRKMGIEKIIEKEFDGRLFTI